MEPMPPIMPAESQTTKRIPVSAAKKVADQFGLKQCLLIGWDGESTHVVTYGKTKADCEAAAKAQDFWTGHIREFSFKGEPAAVVRLAPTDPVPEDFMGLAAERFPLCPDCGQETELTSAPTGRWWNCRCGWEGMQNV